MANISRANVHDVLRNKPRDRVVIATENGKTERRVIKRPEGRVVEQMVDPQGNVVWIKLLALGTNQGGDAAVAKRHEMRQLGFVEYHKCPLLNGTQNDAKFKDELALMPEHIRKSPCEDDPVIHERRGNNTFAHESCHHVEWLVADRRARAAEERELRATKIDTAVDIERQKLAIAEQSLAEQRETNKRTAQLLEQLAGNKAKKGDKAE